MSGIVPSQPDRGGVTLRRVSRSPAVTTLLLVSAVVLAVLWRTTEDSRFQLLGNLDDNQLMLDELKQERDELNQKIGELEKSLADTRAKLDFALSERDAKTGELETTREALAQLREQQAVDKVNIEQLNTRLIEVETARDKATAERDEARLALAKALEENESDDLRNDLEITRSDLAASNKQLESTNAELESVREERDSAFSERDAARSERDAAIKERGEGSRDLAESKEMLEEAQSEISRLTKERDEARTESDAAIEERDAALVDLAELVTQLAEIQKQLEEALAQQGRAHSVLLLEGTLEERSFPRASFYLAKGTTQLEAGEWSLIVGDIGGQDATRAGAATVTYTVYPSSCVRELEGDWPGALALDCLAGVEWIVESRYPHFLLNILPLADSTTVPEEVEAAQDE